MTRETHLERFSVVAIRRKKERRSTFFAKLPQYGKITKDFFDSVIYPNLGRRNKKILVGPSPGVDTCVIKTGENQVVVATTDPISYIPELGPKDSAWQSVNLIASDLATSGFPPQFALFDFNLPPTMKSSDFEKYWDALSQECKTLGIAISRRAHEQV